jgi:hypothetical protein
MGPALFRVEQIRCIRATREHSGRLWNPPALESMEEEIIQRAQHIAQKYTQNTTLQHQCAQRYRQTKRIVISTTHDTTIQSQSKLYHAKIEPIASSHLSPHDQLHRWMRMDNTERRKRLQRAAIRADQLQREQTLEEERQVSQAQATRYAKIAANYAAEREKMRTILQQGRISRESAGLPRRMHRNLPFAILSSVQAPYDFGKEADSLLQANLAPMAKILSFTGKIDEGGVECAEAPTRHSSRAPTIDMEEMESQHELARLSDAIRLGMSL